jgi:hypothetical protein
MAGGTGLDEIESIIADPAQALLMERAPDGSLLASVALRREGGDAWLGTLLLQRALEYSATLALAVPQSRARLAPNDATHGEISRKQHGSRDDEDDRCPYQRERPCLHREALPNEEQEDDR